MCITFFYVFYDATYVLTQEMKLPVLRLEGNALYGFTESLICCTQTDQAELEGGPDYTTYVSEMSRHYAFFHIIFSYVWGRSKLFQVHIWKIHRPGFGYGGGSHSKGTAKRN